jgi:transcriptional regulator with XRE-family HTH domain|tara:strand:- start:94 stop:486 length:393 start_codon:yes stop_codon:yes gene_type:complete
MSSSNFAQRVAELRKSKGLSQTDLGNLVGVVWQNIQNVELGKVTRPRYLEDLAAALDVSVDYLLSGNTTIQSKGASNPFSLIAVDQPILPNKEKDIYVVSVNKGEQLYLANSAEQVGMVAQIFIGHVSPK